MKRNLKKYRYCHKCGIIIATVNKDGAIKLLYNGLARKGEYVCKACVG